MMHKFKQSIGIAAKSLSMITRILALTRLSGKSGRDFFGVALFCAMSVVVDKQRTTAKKLLYDFIVGGFGVNFFDYLKNFGASSVKYKRHIFQV